MGIYSDNVTKLFENGIFTIPCGDKKEPLIGRSWQKFCDVAPTAEEISQWESQYSGVDRLGLLLGKSSKIVAFDFDYAFDKKVTVSEADFKKDLESVEKQILSLLPHAPCKKVGRKGWTAFYKWNDRLTNTQCDRNGTRLFDFLAWHKQTIIPPSLHSYGPNGEAIFYKWKGLTLEEALRDDALPEITMENVLEIKDIFGDSSAKALPTRHSLLLNYVITISRVERDIDVIVENLIERDKIINDPPYLSDKKHFPKSQDPKVNATEWVKRIVKWKGAAPVRNKVKENVADEAWIHFFEKTPYKVQKDLVSGIVFAKMQPHCQWEPVKNLVGVYRAYAVAKSLPKMHVSDELDKWVCEKKDVGFLCDIPKWDGVDRVEQIASSLMSDRFTRDEVVAIFKHWGSCMFGRAEDPTNQNRCIILKGAQNLGKDTFVRSLLEDFRPYYKQTPLAGSEKDVLEIVSPLLAVHIEEFDQTSRLSIPFIKSLITQDSAFFRESYGRVASSKSMRASYISTSNADDVLRDPTGNRRFIIIPIDLINWGYPKGQSIQCIAQWKEYWEKGLHKTLSPELEAKIASLTQSYTPDDIATAVVERYQLLINQQFPAVSMSGGKPFFTLGEVTPVFAQIAKEVGVSFKRVQHIIKMAGCSRRFSDGTRYFRASMHSVNGNFMFDS